MDHDLGFVDEWSSYLFHFEDASLNQNIIAQYIHKQHKDSINDQGPPLAPLVLGVCCFRTFVVVIQLQS